jgi:threonine/homoserine/homoserine lactone efflux protein
MFDFLTFAVLIVLGTISPGPDFAIVTRFGLAGSRRTALLATLGITCALFIHVFYCISGIALFLQKTPSAMYIIRFIGAFYLGYLGIKMLQEKSGEKKVETPANHRAFLTGFMTNLLNPKATLFLLSIFTQFAHSYPTWKMKACFALWIPFTAIVWFSLLSCFLTHPSFLPYLQEYRRRFTLLMGLILILLAATSLFQVTQFLLC